MVPKVAALFPELAKPCLPRNPAVWMLSMLDHAVTGFHARTRCRDVRWATMHEVFDPKDDLKRCADIKMTSECQAEFDFAVCVSGCPKVALCVI